VGQMETPPRSASTISLSTARAGTAAASWETESQSSGSVSSGTVGLMSAGIWVPSPSLPVAHTVSAYTSPWTTALVTTAWNSRVRASPGPSSAEVSQERSGPRAPAGSAEYVPPGQEASVLPERYRNSAGSASERSTSKVMAPPTSVTVSR